MAEHDTLDPIVGIDLGTTNSLVAHADPAHGLAPRIIPDDAGRALLPSIVRYAEDGSVAAVGWDARLNAVEFADRTISSIKRLMGRSIVDAHQDLPYLPYEVIEGPHHTARVKLPSGKVVSPQEVSAAILTELKTRASRALGVPVRRAVVTVPAYFDDAQRQATRDAGRLAGLEVVRIVNEPTAASLAYGIGLGIGGLRAETIAVFDLGGGTFDVSILRVIPSAPEESGSGGADFFQVLATAGDTHLGGDDVDMALVRLMLDEIAVQGGAAFDPTPSQSQSLRSLAESAKVRLSDHGSAQLALSLGTTEYKRDLGRAEFEALIAPWVDRAVSCCQRAIRDARLTAGSIDRVIMVGGSTRIPLVRSRVAEFFGVEPYTALNPDEVVALGAAVQGSIMAGLRGDALLLDVIPLSMGIETVGGAVAKLILRNTTVPARATEMFSTSVDGQTSIKIQVLQGEREMAADCRSLGTFHLRGLPPMPAGIPKVQVEFLVDAGGVLSVSAIEQRSGKRAAIQIVPNHGLTREEVERIEIESFAHAREDMARHRIIDLITNSRLDVKWITDRLDKHESALDPAYRDDLRGRIAAVREIIQNAEADWSRVSPDEFHRAKEELDRASTRLHEISITASLRGDSTGSKPS